MYSRPLQVSPLALLCIALLAFAPAAEAVLVENLYRAEVPVEDHGTRELQRATREGLAQVLVKVSGDREVLSDARVREALSDNRRYLQQYQYLRKTPQDLVLQVEFDPESVTGLLRESQQTLWTANRPPLLLWIVVDDTAGRQAATPDTHPELLAMVQSELERRGVPVLFPLHDLEDALALNVHELWRQDRLAVYRASQRYPSDNILVGRFSELSGQRWMGDWMLLQGEDVVATSFFGQELPEGLVEGVDFAADRMARRYAVAAGAVQGEEVLIRIDHLASYGDYQEARRYLEGIELVDRAYPTKVEGDSMVFRLHAQAQADQLHRIFALSRRLEVVDISLPPGTDGPAVQRAYRWMQ